MAAPSRLPWSHQPPPPNPCTSTFLERVEASASPVYIFSLSASPHAACATYHQHPPHALCLLRLYRSTTALRPHAPPTTLRGWRLTAHSPASGQAEYPAPAQHERNVRSPVPQLTSLTSAWQSTQPSSSRSGRGLSRSVVVSSRSQSDSVKSAADNARSWHGLTSALPSVPPALLHHLRPCAAPLLNHFAPLLRPAPAPAPILRAGAYHRSPLVVKGPRPGEVAPQRRARRGSEPHACQGGGRAGGGRAGGAARRFTPSSFTPSTGGAATGGSGPSQTVGVERAAGQSTEIGLGP